jgi:N-acetyl-anhydromuramyl-L-alanine amidase AmpD
VTELAVTTPHAYHFSHGSNEPVTRIVLHDEEYPVGVTSAENVAGYFAKASAGGSAHYVVDADSVEHPLAENIIAWHAPPNQGSIGIEHDGYARFTAEQWAAPGSDATLRRSAALVAEICHRRVLPVQFVTAAQLKANPRVEGITTHAEVTAAFHQSDHTDPGAHFPMAHYLDLVRAQLARLTAPAVGARYHKVTDADVAACKVAGIDVLTYIARQNPPDTKATLLAINADAKWRHGPIVVGDLVKVRTG